MQSILSCTEHIHSLIDHLQSHPYTIELCMKLFRQAEGVVKRHMLWQSQHAFHVAWVGLDSSDTEDECFSVFLVV